MNIDFIGQSKKINLIINLIAMDTNGSTIFYYDSNLTKVYRKYYEIDDNTRVEFKLKDTSWSYYSKDNIFIIIDLSSKDDLDYLNSIYERYLGSKTMVILGIQCDIGKEHERIISFEDMKMYEKYYISNSLYYCKYFEVSTERESVDAFNNLNASFKWAANQILFKDIIFSYKIIPFKFSIDFLKCSLVSNCISKKIKIYNSLKKEMIVQGCNFKLYRTFQNRQFPDHLILLFDNSDQSSFEYIKKSFNNNNCRQTLYCTLLIGVNINTNHQIQSYSQSNAVSNEEINKFMNQLPICKYFEINSNDDYQYVCFEFANHVLNNNTYLKVDLEEEKKLYNGNNEKNINREVNKNMKKYKKTLKKGYSDGCTIN